MVGGHFLAPGKWKRDSVTSLSGWIATVQLKYLISCSIVIRATGISAGI